MSPVDIYSFSALFSSQHVFSNPALKKQTNLQPVVCIFCLFVCFVSITHLQVVLWQHRFKYRYQYLKTQFSYSTEHKTLTLAHNFPFTIGTMCSVLSFGCKWFNVWFESLLYDSLHHRSCGVTSALKVHWPASFPLDYESLPQHICHYDYSSPAKNQILKWCKISALSWNSMNNPQRINLQMRHLHQLWLPVLSDSQIKNWK